MNTKIAVFFEKARYLSLIGVVALLLSAIGAFIWGGYKTYHVLMDIVASHGKSPHIAVSLLEVVDAFLIAIGLLIFSFSIYEMFIKNLNLPEWLLAQNLSELKEKLGGIIILVMVVRFVEELFRWKNPQETLIFACAITLISGTIMALNALSKK